MKNKFSENYQNLIKIYADMHNNGTTWDYTESTFDEKYPKYFFSPIKQIIDLTESKSLIDFVCGKAKFYFNNIKIKKIEYKNVIEFCNIQDNFLYDPGIEEFSTYPNIFPYVICATNRDGFGNGFTTVS